MDKLKKGAFPAVLIIIGLFLFYLSTGATTQEVLLVNGDVVSKEYNTSFGLASLGFILAGLIIGIINFVTLKKGGYLLVFAASLVSAAGMSYVMVNSILTTIKEDAIIKYKNTEIKQRMSDIRTGLKAYQAEEGNYPESIDSLLAYVKTSFVYRVEQEGAVDRDKNIVAPYQEGDIYGKERAKLLGYRQGKDADGRFVQWNDEDAVRLIKIYEKKGLLDHLPSQIQGFKRDSIPVPMVQSLYETEADKKARTLAGSKLNFNIDSLKYVPFSGGREFFFKSDTNVILNADTIKLNVFLLKDMQPLIPGDTLIMGDLMKRSDRGNWEIKQ